MDRSGKKRGAHSYVLPSRPRIRSYASIAGQKEASGPLGHTFDETFTDDTLGQKSWERAEAKMLERAVDLALSKAKVYADGVDVFLGGDLLNQIVSSGYTARQLGIPFLGLYGACSTMAESLLLGAMLIDGGFADTALCATCSHFSTAERQYRFPLELGNQRTPTAQWTVTGAGATLLGRKSPLPLCIESVTIGSVWDLKQTDANNMGAAMAPAAYDTLCALFRDTRTKPEDYDLIVTGDLGRLGHQIVSDFFARDGLPLGERYTDCGLLLYDIESQDMHCGGSGCGCSASVLCGYLLRGMREGKWNRIIFAPTGALLSPTSSWQGESIPGVCHAVAITAEGV